MNFCVLTLFPEMIEKGLDFSVIKRASDNGIINIKAIDIRNFSKDKHKHVDDYPYGGGAGMVMQPQPVYDAYEAAVANMEKKTRVLYMTPQGRKFSQADAQELSKESDLIILCGHYEGIDERVIEEIVTDEISVGDFILTGGELAAMIVIDSVSRLIPGVLNKEESFMEESFSNGLLEYPQYTRPPVFHGKEVPEVLLSGHHKRIDEWRREQSVIRTAKKRPELLKDAQLSEKEKILAEKIRKHDYSKQY
ncbi:MAG: tRNA (guanosine(37)-N1)-methyltransferase TrmD [Firmicutes bacterium]|nr:tRNA (guanosine(37)-N1)-methyltransferase TrmD [Bacillota bacterium]